ncbi:MAG: UPF0280 family protein [Pseudomonadota bacterium]|nr:UPF0280 family protein [Pseudomonadota bacterium]
MNAPLPTGFQASLFGANQRLHIQHGPTDLVIDADGPERLALFEAAVGAMREVLAGLAEELPLLRAPWEAARQPAGPVARRMHDACRLADVGFVTPMAAVAGAIADHVLAAMMQSRAAATATKISVNNGGDIAFWTGDGAITRAAIAGPDFGSITLQGPTGWRGMATSGHGGRSLSTGIADSVTVLADSAAGADVAATLIAGAVDCPGVAGIQRRPAREINPDSDLGSRPVTVGVPQLGKAQIEDALSAGRDLALRMMKTGRIAGAVLELQGEIAVAGLDDPAAMLISGDVSKDGSTSWEE